MTAAHAAAAAGSARTSCCILVKLCSNGQKWQLGGGTHLGPVVNLKRSVAEGFDDRLLLVAAEVVMVGGVRVVGH